MYKMAGVMAQCGGLECMLNRLAGIKDFKQGRHLLTVSRRQQDGTSPPLLEGPGRCRVALGGSMALRTRARQGPTWPLPWPSVPQAPSPSALFPTPPPEHQCDSRPLLCLSSHLWTPVSNCLSTQNCTVSVIVIII